MDFENSENVTNSTMEEDITNEVREIKRHEIIFFIFGIIALFSNIIIIYTILKYKKLRNFIPNLYIAHCCFVDILFLIVVPYTYLEVFKYIAPYVHHKTFCFIFDFGVSIHFAKILSVCLLMIDGLLIVYFKQLSKMFQKYYKCVLVFFWILICVIYFVSTYFCICDYYFIDTFMGLLICLFLVALVLVAVLQCLRCIQKIKHSVPSHSLLQFSIGSSFIKVHLIAFLIMVLLNYLSYDSEFF